MALFKLALIAVASIGHSGSAFLYPGATTRISVNSLRSGTTTLLIHHDVRRKPTRKTNCILEMKPDDPPSMLIDATPVNPKRQLVSLFAERLRFPLFRRILPLLRRRLITFSLAILVLCSAAMGAKAVSAGRSGGSFGPSSSYSSRSSSSSSSSSHYSRPIRMNAPPPQIRIHRNPSPSITVFTRPTQTRVYTSTMAAPVATRVTVSDVILLTGTGALISYGFLHNARSRSGGYNSNDSRSSPLGLGATVACITVAMYIPNRDDPTNVLRLVRAASERADTGTRRGVQDLVSEVALELMRQERSIVSAATQWEHFDSPERAQRAFQQQSIRHRAKFDRESVNKFGGEDRSEHLPRRGKDDDGAGKAEDLLQATAAVASLHVAIEGDATQLPSIRVRQDLLEALSKLASDAQVGECLLSAEILWAPEERQESLSMSDVYADYPDLIPL